MASSKRHVSKKAKSKASAKAFSSVLGTPTPKVDMKKNLKPSISLSGIRG